MLPGTGTWQSCDAGVAIFVPDENSVPSVRESSSVHAMMSRMSIDRKSNASIAGLAKERTNVQSSRVVRHPLVSLPLNHIPINHEDSPSTIQGDDNKVILTPVTSASDSIQDWYQQLQHSINSEHRLLQNEDFPKSPTRTYDYDSDRTDFLLSDPETPCPKRTAHAQNKSNVTSNRRSRPQSTRSVVRRLSFGGTSNTLRLEPKRNEEGEDGEDCKDGKDLRSIEGSPKHKWTELQELYLCVLWRFYIKETPSAKDFVKVWNQVTGLSLPTRKVKDHLQNYIRLFGAKAYPVYGEVFFQCSLDDPNNKYIMFRLAIEEAAKAVSVTLRRRTTDEIVSSGHAEFAKCVRTRKLWKKLVRRARSKNKYSQGNNLQLPQRTFQWKLGGIAIPLSNAEQLEISMERDEPELVNTPEQTTPRSAASPRCQPQQPDNLAFRVWDKNSHTDFSTERGFVSGLHSIWNGLLLPAPQLDTVDGRNCHLLLSNTHLSKTGKASAYVSIATSLVQVLNYATNMQDPQIAVVNLLAPSLYKKKLKASDILRELKSMGQAQWARYRGTAEIMVFGSIEMDAIIHHGSLSELVATVTAQTAGEILLDSEKFKPDQTVSDLVSALKAKDIILTHDLARAMAVWARSMKLHTPIATASQLTEFVQVLVDGWTITVPEDVHLRSSIAQAFAIVLASETLLLQDSLNAFIKGCTQGEENLAYYSSRRRRPSYGCRRS